MKNDMTQEQPRTVRKRKNDMAVYKVMIGLAVLCAALLGLRFLREYYGTVGGFAALYDRTPVIAGAGVALAAVSALLLVLCRKPAVRVLAPWFLTAGAVTAVTGWLMRESGVEDFNFLIYLCSAILVLYIIFQLYRWEFFMFSLSTATAGGLFFSFSRGMYWTGKNIVLIILLVLVLAGTTVCTWKASQNRGWLMVGKKKIHLFPMHSIPLLIILANVLWLVCGVAVLFLGGLFAYYCMFAALAVEFIAAVYYTFQLN